MTIKFYRTHMRLELPDSTQLEIGQIFTSDRLSSDKIGTLVEMEVISEAQTPPLVAIPGWRSRAVKLSKSNIETMSQLWEADEAEIAELCNLRREGSIEIVRGWKSDLLGILEYRRH